MAGVSVTCDSRDLIPLLKGLGKVEKSLRDESNNRLRNAAGKAAGELAAQLKQSASSSATPQAAIVADSIRIKRDRLVSVSIGITELLSQAYLGATPPVSQAFPVHHEKAPAATPRRRP